VRFGLLIPQSGPPEVLLGRCLEAERLGFESLWIGDHFYLEAMPHIELLEAMTVLGAIAVSVPRVRFGAMTTNAIYRNPAVVAKQAATLDVLSGGRFELALGAGVYDADHRMTGSRPWAPGDRVDRFSEFVGIVDRLLRGDTVDGGPYYPLDGAIVTPRPIQRPRPPLTIGANGPRMIRLAAERADRWNTWGGRGLAADELWSVTEARTRAFDRAVEAAGRDRGSVTRSLYVFRPLEPWSSVEAFREVVARGRSTGLDELLFAWPGFLQESGTAAQLEVMRRVAADVLPDEMAAAG
jgi:alkanesulfonate monooxygenase SsuD/methylene tetrahydromethanopterin reductase-like flavin-dependent oxidoreductase (luciferase family)